MQHFMDLEKKAFDQVHWKAFLKVLTLYGMLRILLHTTKSFYNASGACVSKSW